MSRIISILSLVMILGGLGYAYQTGLLMQVLNPRITVLVAEQDLVENQPVRQANFSIQEVSINDVEPGSIVYPGKTDKKKIAQSFARKKFSRVIEKGTVLGVADMVDQAGVFLMRTIADIGQGQKLERSNVIVYLEAADVPEGAITFSSEDAAYSAYLKHQRLSASHPIAEGQIVRIDDVAGGAGVIYVMISRGDFKPGDLLSLDDIEISARSTDDVPRGAVSFPSKDAGEIFVSTSGGMTLSKGMNEGDVFVVSSIAKTGGSSLSDGELPTTLAEYLEFEAKFPETTMFVDEKILVGSEPMEGNLLDLWVEMDSTSGPFGVIKIRRVAKGLNTFQVSNEVQTEDGPKEEFVYWSNLGRASFKAVEEARRDDRIAFILNNNTAITDFLGNGAVCRGDVCSISRAVSSDMSVVRMAFDSEGELVEESEESQYDPLTVLDGVDQEIERRLIARGYGTFRDIAAWEDAAIKVTAFNLEISHNLAIYIRQQARNIVENPERSRRDLGLTNNEIGG